MTELRRLGPMRHALIVITALGLSVPSASAETTKLTLTQGTNMAAALSPDEQNFVFDLQGTLWVMDREGGRAETITDILADAREPHWSPDGRQIAFQSYEDGYWHIWTVNRDGSSLRQRTFGAFDDREPFWHREGGSIVFSSDRGGSYDIWSVSLDDGSLTQVTDGKANEFNPAVDGTGTKLAYVSDAKDQPGIMVRDLIGGEASVLVEGGGYRAPSWDKTGDTISYRSGDRSSSALQILDIESGDVRVISQSGADVFPFRAAWTSDGALFYTADGHLKKRAPDGSVSTIPFEAAVKLKRPNYKRKTYDFRTAETAAVKGILGPAPSPDGKTVALTALGDIWLIEDGAATKLTDDAHLDLDPIWSPDGQSIAFLSDRDGIMNVWVRDLGTGEERQITKLDTGGYLPSWSPDSRQIALYQPVGLNGLAPSVLSVVDVETGEALPVHPPLWGASRPTWSPDGKRLAVAAIDGASTRFREGFSRILIVSLDGGPNNFVTLSPDGSLAARGRNGPVWSPDGKWMAYIQAGRLWAVPVSADGSIAGEARPLTEGLADSPSWDGNSKSLVFIATDKLTRVWLDGRFEELPTGLTWSAKIPQTRTVVRAGRLFDGVNDRYALEMDIVIDGNVIADIVPRRPWPEDVTVVDASDKTVIPGLFERHAHQNAGVGEVLGRIWLAYGITAVREPGADPYDALERKEAWMSGRRLGPRQFFTGAMVDGARSYWAFATPIASNEHLEMELDRAETLDYDLIKTYVRLPDHWQKQIVRRAHRFGIPVSSHELYPAVAYGVDAVEHLQGTSRRGYSPKISQTGISYGDMTDLIARSGMTITPTLGISGGYAVTLAATPAIADNRQYQALYSPAVRAGIDNFVAAISRNPDVLRQRVAAMQATILRIVNSGGRVTAGTDAPIIPFGLGLIVELQSYVDGGLTPFQVLQTATLWSAEATGVGDQLGSIERDKIADLAVVDGDPLNDITALYNVVGTVANGVYYNIDTLLAAPWSNAPNLD